MKMAKASNQEIEECIDLAYLIESVCHPRNFELSQFPSENEDEMEPQYFDENNNHDLREFYQKVTKLSTGLMRVANGYSVLIDNCCDPDAKTLEWKKGIVVPEETEEKCVSIPKVAEQLNLNLDALKENPY